MKIPSQIPYDCDQKKTGEKIFKPAAECVVYEHNKPKNDMRVDG